MIKQEHLCEVCGWDITKGPKAGGKAWYCIDDSDKIYCDLCYKEIVYQQILEELKW